MKAYAPGGQRAFFTERGSPEDANPKMRGTILESDELTLQVLLIHERKNALFREQAYRRLTSISAYQ